MAKRKKETKHDERKFEVEDITGETTRVTLHKDLLGATMVSTAGRRSQLRVKQLQPTFPEMEEI